MGSFRHGVVGAPPRSRKRPLPRPVIEPEPESPVEEDVVIEVVDIEVVDIEVVDIQDEDEANVEVVEIEPKLKLKDMTKEQLKAFYKARAEKARATRERKKAIAVSQQE
jgi:hypothetical protein